MSRDDNAKVAVHHVATRVHGRYLLANGDSQGAPLIVGCHGYGENADRHLEKLGLIPGADGWVLCAVQGLHRFYNTRTGDVLASWMTSQDRELAIVDNLAYLTLTIADVRRRCRCAGPLVFAGFSQGVAMAYRAALGSGFPCDGLIVLAGDVPPDVAEIDGATFPPILLGRGTGDEWYTEEKMDKDLEVLEALGAQVTTCVFDGGHDWTPEFLETAGEFLDVLSAG